MASYFVNPWMLLALFGAAIPIIIELIFRRRRRQIDLPTLRYLMKNPAQKKIQRQDRLLLILRCMVPVFLAAAVARPLLAPGGAVRNRHVIIVMDQTISMGQQVGVSTAFALAKNKATRLIAALPAGTRVSIVALAQKAEGKLDHSDDLYAARELIDGMKITDGAATLADAMPVLQESLAHAGEKQEIYLLSDFQKSTIIRGNAVEKLRKMNEAAGVVLVDVGGDRPFNYYFTDLSPEEPLLVAGRDCRFHATVAAKGNSSNPDPHARITLLVNQVQQGMREVPLKSGSATVDFDYRFPSAGEYQMEVSVEGDTFRLDNHRYYLAAVPESQKVLIVDEASSDGAMSPEASYLSAAISPMDRPGLDRPSIFTCKVISPDEINRENLSEYCSAIVLGMERVPDDLVLKLEPYVRDGGSAVFFLSGRSNAFEYNQHLFKDGKGVMPVRLEKSDSAADLTLNSNWAIPTSQPSIPVARFMSLNGANNDEVLANFSNGKPAVLQSRYGKGKVMTFCTAAGPPDNLLPASFVYPLMLQEILRSLADNPDRGVNLQIGQTFKQDVMISSQHVMLRKPDGTKVRLTPTGDATPAISFDQTDQMGLYALDVQAGVVKRGRFVVNLGSEESDLDRLDEKDAANMFPEATWLRPASPIEEMLSSRYSLTELAGPLLWALAALMTVETFLAVRFGMRRHS